MIHALIFIIYLFFYFAIDSTKIYRIGRFRQCDMRLCDMSRNLRNMFMDSVIAISARSIIN